MLCGRWQKISVVLLKSVCLADTLTKCSYTYNIGHHQLSPKGQRGGASFAISPDGRGYGGAKDTRGSRKSLTE